MHQIVISRFPGLMSICEPLVRGGKSVNCGLALFRVLANSVPAEGSRMQFSGHERTLIDPNHFTAHLKTYEILFLFVFIVGGDLYPETLA